MDKVVRKSSAQSEIKTSLARIVSLEEAAQRKLDEMTAYLNGLATAINSVHAIVGAKGASAGALGNSQMESVLSGGNIREVYLTDLFPGIEQISVPIGAINEESGHANHVDLLYVNAIARVLEAKRIFEFGTYLGRTTYHLALSGPDVNVVSLNLPPEEDKRIAPFLGSYFKGTEVEAQIELVLQDSRKFDTEAYKNSFDLIFVDGDHSYELIANDTKKAFELLKPGGTIIWHDFAAKSPGVLKFLGEFSEETPIFRVKDTCLVVLIDGVDARVAKFSDRRKTLISKP